MYQVEALPILYALSQSDDTEARCVFLRIYFDLFDARRARGEAMPEDWSAALRAALVRPVRQQRAVAVAPMTREEIDRAVRQGDVDLWIALAQERRLRGEQVETLVARAQALSDAGDARLARSLLARAPLRLEHAPLFLEADAQQRAALLLAAQRAELGRKAGPTRTLDPALAMRLEFAAIAGADMEFAEAFAEALGASVALAARLAADPGGEALVVALTALGAPRDLGVRILTACDIGEGGGAFPRLQALTRLAGQLTPAAARRIVDALAKIPVSSASTTKASASRDVQTPSPFARREAVARALIPETSKRSAQNNRRP